jgi:formate dehydrogenase major subunit
MTNHWIDLKNSDAILAIGCNPAENHPISFKWIEEALDNGAKLISVDPRYTRTASKADIYAQLRPGTDIAFLGGLINYALQHDLIHREYVRDYTNASFIVGDAYGFEDGMFCSFDDEEKSYDLKSWAYSLDADGAPRKDPSMGDQRCIYQLLKKHYARYDVETVCSITGTRMEDFFKVARAFCGTGRPDKAGTILYAMGITQSTHGSQNVRAVALLQMLLGNIGIAGGGVNALRGESNVQGSTVTVFCSTFFPAISNRRNSTTSILPPTTRSGRRRRRTRKAPTGGATPPSTSPACSRGGTGRTLRRKTTSATGTFPSGWGTTHTSKSWRRWGKGRSKGWSAWE